MLQKSRALAYLSGIAGFIGIAFGTIPAQATDRLALLIGNSRYEHATPLRNPENDVDLLETSLRKAKFRSFVGKNTSKQQLDKLIEDFLAAAKSSPSPVLVIYFSGHGIERDGRNYLVPIDALPDDPDQLTAASLNANDLLAKLRAIGPELAVLILDACRDDPENASKSLRRGLVPIPLEPAAGQRIGQLVAYATSPGKTAADGDAGNSPYASALAEQMIFPGQNLEAVFRETRKKVVERTKGTQEPREDSALYDDFYFIPAEGQTKIDNREEAVWDLASAVNSSEGYQRYLEKFPQGLYVELAQRKIAAINTDFTYRRKSETFPILQRTFFEFPLCRKQESWFAKDYSLDPIYAEQLFTELEKFGTQIVYVDFEIPITTIYCEKNKGSELTEVGFKEKTCAPKNSVPCEVQEHIGDAPGAKLGEGWPTGGVIWKLSTHYKLKFPNGQTESYRTEYYQPEGSVIESALYIRGLVRLEISGDDGFITIGFKPVDARDQGMTWKFDNTAALAKKNSDEKRAAINWHSAFDGILVPSDDESGAQSKSPPTSSATSQQMPPRSDPTLPKRTYWAHNGSTMYLESDGGRRRIYYEQPRAGMIEVGVTTGTLLFDGIAEGNVYRGKAFIFNRTCGRAEYAVTGPILDDGRRVVLQGSAPRITKTCKVSGFLKDTLEFTFLPERSGDGSR